MKRTHKYRQIEHQKHQVEQYTQIQEDTLKTLKTKYEEYKHLKNKKPERDSILNEINSTLEHYTEQFHISLINIKLEYKKVLHEIKKRICVIGKQYIYQCYTEKRVDVLTYRENKDKRDDYYEHLYCCIADISAFYSILKKRNIELERVATFGRFPKFEQKIENIPQMENVIKIVYNEIFPTENSGKINDKHQEMKDDKRKLTQQNQQFPQYQLPILEQKEMKGDKYTLSTLNHTHEYATFRRVFLRYNFE